MSPDKPLAARRPALILAAAAVLALSLSSCRKTPSDTALSSQVQSRLASDPNLSGQTVQASVSSGVATLSGSVTSDSARNTAAADAAQIDGIRTVVNNLTIQPFAQAPASATVDTTPPAPIIVASAPPAISVESIHKPSAAFARNAGRPDSNALSARNAYADHQGPPQSDNQGAPIERAQPVPVQQPPVQAAPPPPPQPQVRSITLAAGTTIPVRITQTLDSASTQQGDKFTGVVASDIVLEGVVVLPQGTAVTGHVDAVQDAAHFKGSSLLTVSLSNISRKGERLDIITDPYTKQGEGRGKNTAEKVGGGAAVGAILGGIFGGGKGAAIGTAAGAGVGAGAQGVTRGQQVQIPSESIIRFKLTNSVPVRVTINPSEPGYNNQGLERREP